MSGQTPRSRRWRERREVDPDVVRYFVYFLCDADGTPVYIGRSCNVPQRIRAHYARASAEREGYDTYRARDWLFDVRSVDMVGPFNWRDVVKRERAEIERHQPRGNRGMTARDHRPAIAIRSAAAALPGTDLPSAPSPALGRNSEVAVRLGSQAAASDHSAGGESNAR